MPTTPGQLFTGFRYQALDADGEPIPFAQLFAYEAGTMTPADTWNDSDLTDDNLSEWPVTADASGIFPAIYKDPAIGYKFVLREAESAPGLEDGAQVDVQDNVLDIGSFLFALLVSAAGSKAVTSGYVVTDDDQIVTVASTGGANPCVIQLPPATDRARPITIQLTGNVDMAVTPDGSDTINSVAAAFTVPAGTTPNWPTITLTPDGVSNWYVSGGAYLT